MYATPVPDRGAARMHGAFQRHGAFQNMHEKCNVI